MERGRPKINGIWSKMEPGAPKGRLCQGPGPILARSEKTCFFERQKNDQKSIKISPNCARADFVAPAGLEPVHFWPGPLVEKKMAEEQLVRDLTRHGPLARRIFLYYIYILFSIYFHYM